MKHYRYHNKRVIYIGIYLTKSDFKESNNREIRSEGESMFIKVKNIINNVHAPILIEDHPFAREYELCI